LASGQLFGSIGKSEFGPDTRSRTGTIHMRMVPDPPAVGSPRAIWTVDVDYHLVDGVDFCPGNTGEDSAFEIQLGTTAASQCESNDVKVEAFYRRTIGPRSTITPAPRPEVGPARTGPAKTTGSQLKVRKGPSRSFPVVGLLPAEGMMITVLGQQRGEAIDGNDLWDQIDRGFVSDRFVTFNVFT
jgi:hypothetical protein